MMNKSQDSCSLSNDMDLSLNKDKKKKRGPVPEDPKWTRIVLFKPLMDEEIELFSISKDLQNQAEEQLQFQGYQAPQKSCIIDNIEFEQREDELDIKNFKLSTYKLKKFAEFATKIRQNIYEKADRVDEEDDYSNQNNEENKERSPNKLQRKYKRILRKGQRVIEPKFGEKYHDCVTRETRKLCDLSIQEKVVITHEVIVQNMSMKDVAAFYGIKQGLVGRLVKKAKENKEFFKELRSIEKTNIDRDNNIANIATEIHETEEGIRQSKQVVDVFKHQFNQVVTQRQVRKIMKNRLNLRYRKIKKISFRGNSAKSLIQRQHFAMEMLKILNSGKRVINIDETWINSKDYRKYKWKVRGQSNSANIQSIEPRISFFTAVDTDGTLMFSLTQVNTDQHVKMLFLTELVSLLDIERPDWRSDTIVLMDNAPYNKGCDIMPHIERLEIPTIFSGSYSYDACPIELFFAYFKKGLLMKQGVPSGKLQV